MSIFNKNSENLDEKIDSLKSNVKYSKPKVCLIDLPEAVFDSLKSAGYNVSCGSFGSPFEVKKSDQYYPLIGEPLLSNIAEQEIIFIDLTLPEILDAPEGEKERPDRENDFWVKCDFGFIDPRPRFMFGASKSFDRILKHGGIFVIFAKPRLKQDIVWASKLSNGLNIEEKVNWDTWSFMPLFSPSNIQIEWDEGEEIIVEGNEHPIHQFLHKNIDNANYQAIFKPSYSLNEDWVPLLKNKFGDDIGGIITSNKFRGYILILPQIAKTPEVIFSLLKEVLPEISPVLFPHLEGVKWVEREEYEFDSIKRLHEEKLKVQKKAKQNLKELDEKIEGERDKFGFLHGILTKTGDELVEDVKKCLEFIGFDNVVDADIEINGSTPKQEDLQIHDSSPTLLMEIKGISGLPDEKEVLQVVKYIHRRMKEWDRRDVIGVSLINHEKHLPPLERNNKTAFTEQQIEDAKSSDITLLTTWNLFILTRGMIRYAWNPEVIKSLFYNSGKIADVPSNYKPIGKIFTYIEENNILGIEITEGKLYKGQRIGYRLPSEFLEEEISSLQVNHSNVTEALSGERAGITTKYSKNQLKKSLIVYEVV